MANKIWSMPSSEAQKKEIKCAIEGTHDIFRAIDNEKEHLTDLYEDLHAKYGIPRRVFNALAKFSYYGNAPVMQEKTDEIMDAWAILEKTEA